MSTADILVFTLQRLYTLPTARVSLDARVCKARAAGGKGRKGEERKWPAGLGPKERKEREKERKTK
jgi:hypothetical protein